MDSQRLKRRFDAWEARMRGYSRSRDRVPIEPAYRPLLGRERIHRGIIDDAHSPGLLDRLRKAPQKRPRRIEPISIPEPVSHEGSGELVELQLLAPSEFTAAQLVGAALISSLSDCSCHVGFELVATKGCVVTQLVCDDVDRLVARRALRAHVPDIRVVDARNHVWRLWEQAGQYAAIGNFALADRVFHRLRTSGRGEPDPLESLIGPVDDLSIGEFALLQILFAPVRAPWAKDLEEFLSSIHDVDKTLPLAQEKFSEPAYAAVVRVAAAANTEAQVAARARSIAKALDTVTRSRTNSMMLVERPRITLEEEMQDVLQRQTHRRGMILSLSELQALVHIPAASVRSPLLLRATARTKAAPDALVRAGLVLGVNEHDSVERPVALRAPERLRHMLVLGATGSGKSTLLLSMAIQDIEQGHGFAVLDPHGDIISDIMARIPEERAKDVVLFDPADEQYPIGFNPLSAHSEIEKTLLASDFVSIFRRLSSTTFGDVMVSVLSNAVLAILESPQGGTLLDLRRFLVDKEFRNRFLKSVQDEEVVHYWQHEFGLVKGVPQASILTRLNTFLRPKLLRYMVAQKKSRVNMRAIMDGKKILLANLSRGLIGEENSHLLGSLLVASIAQATISRQEEEAGDRVPFTLYLDEGHAFATNSVADILSGARKYALSLCFASGGMGQVRSRNETVANALLAHAYTRVGFRLAEQDAKLLADGCSFFEARDFQNLSIGQSIARIERPDFDFNLRTTLPVPVARNVAVRRHARIREASRSAYASPRRDVEAALREPYTDAAAPSQSEAPEEGATSALTRRRPTPSSSKQGSSSETRSGRGGGQHKYLQGLIRRVAEDRGFAVWLEQEILDGHGYVDAILKRDNVRIACEISVTTRIAHELGNLTKCLSADFSYVVLLASKPSILKAARIEAGSDPRLRFLNAESFIAFLDDLEEHSAAVPPEETERAVAAIAGKRRMLDTHAAADYVGVARQTLAKLRVTGGGPKFHKLGARVLYDPDDLDAWLAVRRRRSTSDNGGGQE